MDYVSSAVIPVINNYSVSSDRLETAVNGIRWSYSKEQIGNGTINYNKIDYQSAYIYLYLTCHENIVRNVLKIFWGHEVVRSIFCKFVDYGSVRVCSIGGGPGSDIFGLNSFLTQYFGKVNINGVVLDLFTSWKYIFDALIYELQYANLKNVRYQLFDIFTNYVDWDTKYAIMCADFVPIVKFVSAVCFNRKSIEISLSNLLRYVKPGAIVLFVDNSGGGYFDIMSRAAMSANLQKICEITHQTFQTSLATMYHGINLHPQTSAVVSASLWLKKNTLPSNPNRLDFNNYTRRNRNKLKKIYRRRRLDHLKHRGRFQNHNKYYRNK